MKKFTPAMLACLSLLSCQPKDIQEQTQPKSQPIGAVLMPVNLPVITTLEDIKKFAGQPALIKGRFDVDRIKPTGKGGPFVYIVLADKTHLVYQYSARHMDPSELAFVDKQVVITGKAYPDANQPPHVQQLMSPHVFPDKIELVEGEAPYATTPTDIPAPPVVETKLDLDRYQGRWIQARGTLSGLEKSGEYWMKGTLTLTDKTVLKVDSMKTATATMFEGKQVLLVGIINGEIFNGQVDLCDGALASCEMPSIGKSKTKATFP